MRRIDRMRTASMMPGKFHTVTFANYEVRKENERAFGIARKYVEQFGEMEKRKQEAYDRADTMDNFNEHRAIIYARNESFRIAKELGLKYFLMLDDDYREIDLRYEDEDKLKAKICLEYDRLFNDMIEFLEASGALTVAFCQGGDFVGGWMEAISGRDCCGKL